MSSFAPLVMGLMRLVWVFSAGWQRLMPLSFPQLIQFLISLVQSNRILGVKRKMYVGARVLCRLGAGVSCLWQAVVPF